MFYFKHPNTKRLRSVEKTDAPVSLIYTRIGPLSISILYNQDNTGLPLEESHISNFTCPLDGDQQLYSIKLQPISFGQLLQHL